MLFWIFDGSDSRRIPMLLATNRESTGVGVRPRGDRIEITADFTPDPTMMVAAGRS